MRFWLSLMLRGRFHMTPGEREHDMRAVAVAVAIAILLATAAPAADDNPRGQICTPTRGNALVEILRPRTCAPAPVTGYVKPSAGPQAAAAGAAR